MPCPIPVQLMTVKKWNTSKSCLLTYTLMSNEVDVDISIRLDRNENWQLVNNATDTDAETEVDTETGFDTDTAIYTGKSNGICSLQCYWCLTLCSLVVQVMACCLTTPSHLPESMLHYNQYGPVAFKITVTSPRRQWISQYCFSPIR